MNDSKILFNEKCSICNFEIKHYKKRSELNFVNCSEMEDKYLKKLHVIFDDGKELSGVDAFIYVWEETLVESDIRPYEGEGVLSWKSNGKGWFGAGIMSEQPINLSEAGHLNFRIKPYISLTKFLFLSPSKNVGASKIILEPDKKAVSVIKPKPVKFDGTFLVPATPRKSPSRVFNSISYTPLPVLSTISINGVAESFGFAFNLMYPLPLFVVVL